MRIIPRGSLLNDEYDVVIDKNTKENRYSNTRIVKGKGGTWKNKKSHCRIHNCYREEFRNENNIWSTIEISGGLEYCWGINKFV